MTASRVRFKKPPSKRQVMAWTAFASGDLSQMPAYREPVKRGKQPESKVNDVVRDFWKLLGGALWRNRRGMVDLPNGGKMPIGVGPNGSGDMLGWTPVLITPELLGRTLPVYTEIESKTDTGRLSPDQLARQEYLKDIGAIRGVARNAEDCQDIIDRWRK